MSYKLRMISISILVLIPWLYSEPIKPQNKIKNIVIESQVSKSHEEQFELQQKETLKMCQHLLSSLGQTASAELQSMPV